jgi:hypothetical protein
VRDAICASNASIFTSHYVVVREQSGITVGEDDETAEGPDYKVSTSNGGRTDIIIKILDLETTHQRVVPPLLRN